MLGIGGNVDQLEQSLVVLIRFRLFLGEVEQLGVVDFSDTSGSPYQVLVATDEDLMGSQPGADGIQALDLDGGLNKSDCEVALGAGVLHCHELPRVELVWRQGSRLAEEPLLHKQLRVAGELCRRQCGQPLEFLSSFNISSPRGHFVKLSRGKEHE